MSFTFFILGHIFASQRFLIGPNCFSRTLGILFYLKSGNFPLRDLPVVFINQRNDEGFIFPGAVMAAFVDNIVIDKFKECLMLSVFKY